MNPKCERCGKADLKLIGHNEHGPVQWCEHCGTIYDCFGRRTPDMAYAAALLGKEWAPNSDGETA